MGRKPWCQECRMRRATLGNICHPCREAGHTDNAESQTRRAQQRADAEARVVRKVYMPRERRSVVVDGVDYEVIWDGSI